MNPNIIVNLRDHAPKVEPEDQYQHTGWDKDLIAKFTKDTSITAQYGDDKDIIPYNPEEPITRPVGYVRVSFTAENGLELSDVKFYYVRANSGIEIGKLVKPNVDEEIGFGFDKWDKDDSFEIADEDIVVKALQEDLLML